MSPFPIPITGNTGNLMQIEKMTMSLDQLDSVCNPEGSNLSKEEQIVFFETSLLTKMIQGKTALDIDDSGYDVSVNFSNYGPNNMDVSYQNLYNATYGYSTPGSSILINNTIIDTPNLALITYLDASGFEVFDNSYAIGTNSSGTFYGSIGELDPSSTVYINETLNFNFQAAADISNCDSSEKYYVSFDDSSLNNYWLSKAINSHLNARDNCGNGIYPIKVIEPEFNRGNAMGGYHSSVESDEPFSYYYPDTSLNKPNVNDFAQDFSNNINPDNGETMYAMQNLQSNGTGEDVLFPNNNFGTWKFRYDATNTVSITDYDDNLPFFQGVKDGATIDYDLDAMPNTLTDTELNGIFPDADSSEFIFNVEAVPGTGGGYHFYVESASGDYSSKTLNNTVELNFENLENNHTYMQNNYHNSDHYLSITNGSLVVSGDTDADVSNTIFLNSGLGLESEYLNYDQNINGSIELRVHEPNDRVDINDSRSTNDNLTNISVYYEGETEPSNSYPVGHINDNNNLDYYKTSNINIGATCLLGGYHYDDSESGYMYTYENHSSVSDSRFSRATLYVDENVVYDISFEAGGINSNNFYYITIDTRTDLLDVSSTNLLLDISASPYGYPIPPNSYEPLVQGTDDVKNGTHWSPMDVNAHNINLAYLSYTNFRAVFRPKTISDLSNNKNGFIRVDENTGWSLIYGTAGANGSSEQMFTPGVSEEEGQYLFTAHDNIECTTVFPGYTGAPRSNFLSTSDLIDQDNTNLDISYCFEISYVSAEEAGFTSGSKSDFIKFTPINDTESAVSAPFNSDFYLRAIKLSNSDLNYSSVVQVPLGFYYNLYLQTPELTVTKSDGTESYETVDPEKSLQTTLTFSKGGLLSLLAAIQGSNDPNSDYSNASYTDNGWETFSSHEESGDPLESSIGLYNDFQAELYISNLFPSQYQGYIHINSTYNPNVSTGDSYHLVYPMYAIQLNGTLESYFDINGYKYVKNDTILGDINTDFNAAYCTDFNNLPTNDHNTAIAFTYNIRNDPENAGPNYLDISGVFDGNVFTALITSMAPFRSNMAIWYNRYDIYQVNVSLSGSGNSSNYTNTTYVDGVLGGLNNNRVVLTTGVYLNNTHYVKPNDYVDFNIRGDDIRVRLSDNNTVYDNQNAYFSSSPVPISDANGGLVISTDGLTRSLTLDRYRGFFNNGHTQFYTINRTPTTAQFVIVGNSKPTQRYDFGAININTNENMYFSSDDTNSVEDISGLGIDISFNISMYADEDISYGSTYDSYVSVTGDQVYVYLKQNGHTLIDTSTKHLNDENGYIYDFGPDTTNEYNAIFAGKVIANNNGDREKFRIYRSTQPILITYSESYIGIPSDFEYSGEQSVPYHELSNGQKLNPSIIIYGPSGSLTSQNTPDTYLVIPPPYLGFKALAADAVNSDYTGLPFNFYDSDQCDLDKYYTYYLPMQTNVNDDTVFTSYNPFTDFASSLNDMTFSLFDNYNLTDFVSNGYTIDYSFDLNSQGNYLTLTEYCNDQTNTLYEDFLQDLTPSRVNGANNNYDGDIDSNFGTQTYTIVYAQDLRSAGVYNGANTKITLTIVNAFLHDIPDISINRSINTTTNLYGVSPIVNNEGKYAQKLYKYVNNSTDYGNMSYYNTGALFYANQRYTRDAIQVPDPSFGDVAYDLDTQKEKLTSSDIDPTNNPWILDESFNSQNINFEIAALNNSGASTIQDIFHTAFPDVAINSNYITLNDIMNIKSADGAPVFRVLYNGTTIAPMLSTSQIIINPISEFENLNAQDPGHELVDYNIGTNVGIMADASGIIYE